MLETKLFQVHDRGTKFSVLCILIDISVTYAQDYLILSHAGFDRHRLVLYVPFLDEAFTASINPHAHNTRSKTVSHSYIEKHWAQLKSGAAIDVEFILGETTNTKPLI